MLANRYSAEWFSHFLHGIPREQTAREAAFVDRHLEPGSLVLDVPCGAGRHARLLAARGHRVIGIDRDPSVLGPAADRSVSWLCADMRAVPLAPGRADAILCLWQSFCYFPAGENAALLRRWADLVRPGGRLVLDLYHREFFTAHQGERWVEHPSGRIRETRAMQGDRLIVDLAYAGQRGGDRFEWQLFTPEEMERLAARCGWQLQLSCAGFDVAQAPDPGRPRVQYLFRRSTA
jgi:SAM-dependent methyltransferase